MSKEYDDRWNKPLVNPPFTLEKPKEDRWFCNFCGGPGGYHKCPLDD